MDVDVTSCDDVKERKNEQEIIVMFAFTCGTSLYYNRNNPLQKSTRSTQSLYYTNHVLLTRSVCQSRHFQSTGKLGTEDFELACAWLRDL